MLSLLFYKAIDAIFNGVSIPATVILFIAILVSTFNMYVSSFISHYRSLSLFITLLTSLIGYITGPKAIKLPYISIL